MPYDDWAYLVKSGKLQVTYSGGTPKPCARIYLGLVAPPSDMVVYDNSVGSLLMACLERVFFMKDKSGAFVPPPSPVPGRWTKMDRKFKLGAPGEVSRWSYETYVNSFKGRKRRVYENAVTTLFSKGWKPTYSHCNVFVKLESYIGKANPTARMISPRHPVYNLLLGRYIKSIEQVAYKKLNQLLKSRGSLYNTVAKGMNAAQLGRLMACKFNRFRDPVFVGMDASRFDQKCRKEALLFEHSKYMEWFPRDRMLKWLLKMQLVNTCKGFTKDGFLKYTVDGTRMSGDNNTGLGNTIIMTCVVVDFMDTYEVDYEFIDNGDDCGLFLERCDYEQIFADTTPVEKHFLDLGYVIEVEPPRFILEQCSFCQMSPIFDGDSWIMVRDAPRCILKDFNCTNNFSSEQALRKWMRAVGEGGLSMAGGIPVLQEWYAYLYRNGTKAISDPSMTGGLWWWSKGMRRKYTEIDSQARLSFERAFGIDVLTQFRLEQYYRELEFVYEEPVDQDTYHPMPAW